MASLSTSGTTSGTTSSSQSNPSTVQVTQNTTQVVQTPAVTQNTSPVVQTPTVTQNTSPVVQTPLTIPSVVQVPPSILNSVQSGCWVVDQITGSVHGVPTQIQPPQGQSWHIDIDKVTGTCYISSTQSQVPQGSSAQNQSSQIGLGQTNQNRQCQIPVDNITVFFHATTVQGQEQTNKISNNQTNCLTEQQIPGSIVLQDFSKSTSASGQVSQGQLASANLIDSILQQCHIAPVSSGQNQFPQESLTTQSAVVHFC